jgi:tetratricopeptide (TPR) repeat protein
MSRAANLLVFGLGIAALAVGPAGEAFAQARPKRQPPPPVIPIAETTAAQKQYSAQNYEAAVVQAKAALNKNEKYTPAMLVMAKAYFKLRKYEWVRTLWEMMEANKASEAEKGEMFQILAFLEIEKGNTPQAIELLRKATTARPDNAIFWNNLGAQYLSAKNYREATPALEKAVQLNPTFSKAHLNLGSAYRGLKNYERAQASYQRALQIFSNYADAVFHLGILYLDADRVANMDTIAQLNTAVGHFQRYKQMMGGQLQKTDPVDQYIAEAQDKIVKEQRRIERQKAQQARERERAAQKPAQGAAGAGAAPQPAAPAAPAK